MYSRRKKYIRIPSPFPSERWEQLFILYLSGGRRRLDNELVVNSSNLVSLCKTLFTFKVFIYLLLFFFGENGSDAFLPRTRRDCEFLYLIINLQF